MSNWLLEFRGPNADPNGGIGKAAIERALKAGRTKGEIKDAVLAGSLTLGKAAKEMLESDEVSSK